MSTGSPNTMSWEWAGQQLNSPIAISLFTAPGTRMILFVGVSDGTHSGIIASWRIAEFLQHHTDCTFVCENAADFHWTIHGDANRLGNAASFRDLLWRISAEYRLLDVQLFEQLVQLASTGEEVPLRSLAELLPEWCQLPWESAEQVAAAAFCLQDIQRFPAELVARACNVANSLRLLYNLLSRAAETASQNSVGWTANSPCGPLGLGIQVQARIALARPQLKPIVDDAGATHLIAWLEQEIERQTPNIRKLSRLSECLRWEQNRLVRKSDLPELDAKKLRNLFNTVARELLGADGLPFPYRVDESGKKSVHEQDWGALRLCEPHLQAWFQLSATAQQLHFIRRYRGQPIEINYSIVPRIQQQPRAAILGGLINRGLLLRPDGGQHFMVTFDGLELRALASWCKHRFGNSDVATAFRNHENPIHLLAERLTTVCRGFPHGDDQRTQAAQLLLNAIGLKIGRSVFVKLVQLELNQHVGAPTVESWEQAAFELFPELRSYRADVVDRLAVNLSVPRLTVERELQTCADFATLPAQVLGWNRQQPGPAYGKLTDLIEDTQLKVQAMSRKDPAALYEKLFGRSVRLPTGRIRAKCVFGEGNAEYLDLADDAMKAAIYSLAASGSEIVAMADRGILIWAADQADARSMIKAASTAAARLLDIPVEISVASIT